MTIQATSVIPGGYFQNINHLEEAINTFPSLNTSPEAESWADIYSPIPLVPLPTSRIVSYSPKMIVLASLSYLMN